MTREIYSSSLCRGLRTCAPLLAAVIGASLTGCARKTEITEAPPVRVDVCAFGEEPGACGPSAGDLSGPTALFSGTVEANTTSMLSFNVPGTITAIYVEEGGRVAKGQLLARIRSSSYDNGYEIAKSQLAEAEDAYARMKKLHDADALPDMQWVAVQNQLKQARSAASIASQSAADAAIYAPYGGVVGRKMAQVGQTVITSQPVIELVSASDLMASVAVPETEIGSIAQGARAVVSLPAIGIDSIGARVDRKAAVADPLTRSYNVRLRLPADPRILPGMVCNVAIAATVPSATASDADAATVAGLLPSQAVLLGSDNRTFVWVVRKGRAERRYVTADMLADGGVAVRSGLARGDSVIVAGMEKVGTGTRVNPVTAKNR